MNKQLKSTTMKKMKIWMMAILSAMMMLPQTALADDGGTCGDNLTWTYAESTKTLTIEGTGTMRDYS